MSVRVLTINTGSSSLKAALYVIDQPERREFAADVQRIGLPGSRLRVTGANGAPLHEQPVDLPDHAAALTVILAWLHGAYGEDAFDAVGHRVVHGGARLSVPQFITADLLSTLDELTAIDPDHLPQALAAIEDLRRAYPAVPQVACFDTAFHRNMPRVARMYALPRWTEEAGVVRYGFHGLSYEYIVETLRGLDRGARGRVIVAHLGSGASMVALRDGASVDTTMGFTPTGGLVMGTRSGDLDPGVLLYLLEARHQTPATLKELVNKRAGMLGVSGVSGDMRDLLERESRDPRAAEAIDLFCYQARRSVGALAAVLGGLDTLVFTAGIGEHAAPVRARICTGLEFLGIQIDPRRNEADAPVISREGSRVTVRVIPTNEDLMIARHTERVIRQIGAGHVQI